MKRHPLHVGLTSAWLLWGLAFSMTGCGAEPSTAPAAAVDTQSDDAVADSGGDDVVQGPETDQTSTADIAAAAPKRGPRPIPPPTFAPAAARIVAIGDLHGDIAGTRKALKLAGAIDGQDTWIGDDLVIVQVGDQLDRGDDEKSILLMLDSVATQAHKAGGALYALNGNHETMNVALQFNYVTPGGWLDFSHTRPGPVVGLRAGYPF